jgi:hypothetical protein
MQDNRVVELPYCGLNENIEPLDISAVRTVFVHEELAPLVDGLEFGVPLPEIVMPILLGTTIPEVQVQEPDGILMVSPSTAICIGPLITAFTSLWLHEAAV